MSLAISVAGYVGVGLVVTSALHTWYADHVFDHLYFGLPFSPRYRIDRSVRDGYLGSVTVGLVGFVVVWVYIEYWLSVETLTVQQLLQAELTGFGLVLAVLVALSQVLGGASWSKVVLEIALGAMAFIVVVAHIDAPSFWNLFTIYAAIVPPLGAAWGVWREYYIERQVSGDEPDSVLYPHFPSFTYFVGASLYILFVSLYLLVPTVR